MALPRSAIFAIPLLILAGIAVAAWALLTAEPGPDFDPDGPPPATGPQPTAPKPTGPEAPPVDRPPTPGPTPTDEPATTTSDPAPLIPPPPVREKRTVSLGWTPPGTDDPGGADFPHPGAPPLATIPRDRVFERRIVVETDPGVPKPVRMRVISGTPWGERLFTPEPDGSFLLRDHYGTDGPRIIRFDLDAAGQHYVDRFLPARGGETVVRIGQPATLRVKVVTPGNRAESTGLEVDGKRREGSSELVIPDVHAGNAVARVAAFGHAYRRRVLACPGGPYEILVEEASELRLRVVRGGDGGDTRPFWAAAVPSQGGADAQDYDATRSYDRRQDDTGMIEFLNLPNGWSGTIVIHHPLYATQALAVAHFRDTERIVRPEPRPILNVSVLDATTNRKIERAIVATSADANCVYDVMIAQQRVLPPRGDWRQPVPFLGFSIVDKMPNPPTGHTTRLHIDPLIESLDVLVVAPGYAPAIERDVRVAGVRELLFRLTPLTAETGGTLVLDLPETVAPSDVTLPPLYEGAAIRDDEKRTLTLARVVPGRYRVATKDGAPETIVIGPGETKRFAVP